MQLPLHNFSSYQTGSAGHTRDPHSPTTNATTTHLSSSGSGTRIGDRITRRPVPLAVYSFQVLWNLTTDQLALPKAPPRIVPNITLAFPHESYTSKTRQARCHFLLHTVFQPKLKSIQNPDLR